MYIFPCDNEYTTEVKRQTERTKGQSIKARVKQVSKHLKCGGQVMCLLAVGLVYWLVNGLFNIVGLGKISIPKQLKIYLL